jgi:cation-transporting P-type ATPase F
VNVFVCVQIAYLYSCRAPDRVLLTARLGRNPMLALGIGLTIGLQLLFTYLPAMNVLFGTAPIGVDAWLRAVAAAVAAFVLVELAKVGPWLAASKAESP